MACFPSPGRSKATQYRWFSMSIAVKKPFSRSVCRRAVRRFNAHAIPVDKIHKRDDSPFQFIVGSKSDPSVTYDVDMELGACSCPQGRDGSPCVHQAAVTLHFQSPSFNFIPTLHPSMRRDIAIVALGEQAEKDLAFYSSLHQQENEKSVSNTTTTPNTTDEPDFTRSCWDLIRGGALDDDDDDDTVTHSTQPLLDQERLESQIESLSQSLKFGLETNDPHLITKFLKRYTELSQLPSSGRLASAMHNFSSKERDGVALAPLKCGLLRRGKRIGVQATATGRRKYGSSSARTSLQANIGHSSLNYREPIYFARSCQKPSTKEAATLTCS